MAEPIVTDFDTQTSVSEKSSKRQRPVEIERTGAIWVGWDEQLLRDSDQTLDKPMVEDFLKSIEFSKDATSLSLSNVTTLAMRVYDQAAAYVILSILTFMPTAAYRFTNWLKTPETKDLWKKLRILSQTRAKVFERADSILSRMKLDTDREQYKLLTFNKKVLDLVQFSYKDELINSLFGRMEDLMREVPSDLGIYELSAIKKAHDVYTDYNTNHIFPYWIYSTTQFSTSTYSGTYPNYFTVPATFQFMLRFYIIYEKPQLPPRAAKMQREVSDGEYIADVINLQDEREVINDKAKNVGVGFASSKRQRIAQKKDILDMSANLAINQREKEEMTNFLSMITNSISQNSDPLNVSEVDRKTAEILNKFSKILGDEGHKRIAKVGDLIKDVLQKNENLAAQLKQRPKITQQFKLDLERVNRRFKNYVSPHEFKTKTAELGNKIDKLNIVNQSISVDNESLKQTITELNQKLQDQTASTQVISPKEIELEKENTSLKGKLELYDREISEFNNGRSPNDLVTSIKQIALLKYNDGKLEGQIFAFKYTLDALEQPGWNSLIAQSDFNNDQVITRILQIINVYRGHRKTISDWGVTNVTKFEDITDKIVTPYQRAFNFLTNAFQISVDINTISLLDLVQQYKANVDTTIAGVRGDLKTANDRLSNMSKELFNKLKYTGTPEQFINAILPTVQLLNRDFATFYITKSEAQPYEALKVKLGETYLAKIKDELSKMTAERDTLASSKAALEADLKTKQGDLEAEQRTNAANKTTIESLTGQIVQKNDKIKQLEDDQGKLGVELAQYRAEEEAAKKLKEAEEKRKADEALKMADSESVEEVTKKRIASLVSQLETERAEYAKKVKSLNDSIDQLNAKLANKDIDLDKVKTEISTIKQEKIELKTSATLADSNLKSATDNVEKLRGELTKAQDELIKAKTDLGDAKTNLTEKENLLEVKTQEYDSIVIEYNNNKKNWDKEKKDLDSQIGELTKKNSILNKQMPLQPIVMTNGSEILIETTSSSSTPPPVPPSRSNAIPPEPRTSQVDDCQMNLDLMTRRLVAFRELVVNFIVSAKGDRNTNLMPGLGNDGTADSVIQEEFSRLSIIVLQKASWLNEVYHTWYFIIDDNMLTNPDYSQLNDSMVQLMPILATDKIEIDKLVDSLPKFMDLVNKFSDTAVGMLTSLIESR